MHGQQYDHTEHEQWVREYEQLEKELKMAKVTEMIESKYLKQGDVEDEVVVTIQKVGKGNIAKQGDEPEMKWMIRFAEFSKPMILNSTNIKRLSRACKSEDTDDWAGKKVVLYVDHDVEFAGNIVGGLRIREYKVQPKPHKGGDGGPGPGPEDIESDIPF